MNLYSKYCALKNEFLKSLENAAKKDGGSEGITKTGRHCTQKFMVT